MTIGTTKGATPQNKRERESQLLSDTGWVYATCEPFPQKEHPVKPKQDIFASILAILCI